MARVDLSSSAQKDLSRLLETPVGPELRRIVLHEPPRNRGLTTSTSLPWRARALARVRAGEFRIVLRPLGAAECRARGVTKSYLVDRVVNRCDLERLLKAYR